MPATEAQIKATAKYNSKAYDKIELRVPKGKKTIFQNYAKSVGKSVNALLNEFIEKEINK